MARSKSVETDATVELAEPRSEAPEAPAVGLLDREAWEAAFRRHHHRIVVSLVAEGVPADRARDIAQATWTRLMEQDRAGKLQEVRLPGLAIAQARLLVLEARRRQAAESRRHTVPGDPHRNMSALLDEVEDDGADPERLTLDREQIERALAVIAAAPPSAQRVFRLVFGEPRIQHAEAAERAGLSLQRVRQILCELRKKVRAAMEGDDP